MFIFVYNECTRNKNFKYIETEYTNSRDFLGKTVTVKIDRALHTAHPKHGWAYELNYGFIPDTKSPDDEELDAYVIGVDDEASGNL